MDCRGGLPHSSRSDPYWKELSLSVAARSKHAGGVHALFCDGSVRFVDDNIALSNWQAMATIRGGETF
jgi:prepilin-type processing-associated H-X9-DG protein